MSVEDSLRRLFAICDRAVSPERLDIYAEELEPFPVEAVHRACKAVMAEWTKPSPPPLGVLLARVRREVGDTDTGCPETPDRLEHIRYQLERYSDVDQHVFRDSFGFYPTADTFRRFGLTPEPDVTFEPMDRSSCELIRQESWNAAKASLLAAMESMAVKP